MSQFISRYSLYVFILPVAAFVAGVGLFWHNYLDDTYIHLRYAENFLRSGQMEYNPGQPSFGCSAPLYMWLMSPVLALLPRDAWPLVPKILSICCHAVTLSVCFDLYRTVEDRVGAGDKARWRWEAAFVITALLCPPLVCRWLQDGMETSLATMLCALGIWALSSVSSVNTRWVVLVLSSGLLGGLRVDLLPHAGCILLAGFVLQPRGKMRLAVLVAGGLMVIPHLIMLQTFGTVMPDTAIAKGGGGITPGWLWPALISVSAMNPLWIILGLAPLSCMFLLWRTRRGTGTQIVLIVICMMPLLAVLFAGVMRNQIIQGARYFMPSLLMAGLAALVWGGQEKSVSRWRLPGFLAALVAVLGLTLVRWPQINVIRQGIQADFPPALSACKSIFAADIGIIGWKTGCVIMDYSRLVNGRAVALLSTPEWIRQLAKKGIADGLILDDNDLQGLLAAVPDSRIDPLTQSIEIPSPNGKKTIYIHLGVVMVQQTVDVLYQWRLWVRSDLSFSKMANFDSK